ncbi:MAG: hypothetical protein M3336_09985, partial [Chloroflexota bacterium]|nr:hypothetical protein [Chloroflexota bacterium]
DPADPGDRASSEAGAAEVPPAELPAPARPDEGLQSASIQPNTPASGASATAETESTPPIQVFCFGTPRVLCRGQQVWPTLAGEAKPWELLLYLACQPAQGVGRERLAEALWPDAAEDFDVTHRIRQLRYRLRQAYEPIPGAPASEGICLERTGAVYLDQQIVYSDAQEFLELTRLARIHPGPENIPGLERAQALYDADLLDAPDARRYPWVDERDESGVTLREHFRRRFQQAMLTLAELYDQTERLDAAIGTYRVLTQLDPFDDRLWCALFRLHARRQDAPSLIREERHMRALLRELAEGDEDLTQAASYEPSRETQLEFQRLLASLERTEPAASAG